MGMNKKLEEIFLLIKNQKWVIKKVPTKEMPYIGDEKLYFGLTKYLEQEIYINSELSVQQERQTLIHELTHAFMNVYGFGAITENIPIEIMCDFIGCYGDDIIKVANEVQLNSGFVVEPNPTNLSSKYVDKKFNEAENNE